MPYLTHRPTDVSVVLAYLVELDDFASRKMIEQATGIKSSRVRPALAHLQKHLCIDAVIVNQRELWFYATPASDDRKMIKKETPNGVTRTEKGRKRRAKTRDATPAEQKA